ncbi:35789_t:CDS:1 [Gigaspora margarita]|uniref:35789_t:CDS:1 n=1 Tax=Gigaspora margarita TaxID=4874 RepID=A0ABN7VEK9_GIGMA|nr:35789_t:CDS:1 [Gigaspora margarita]
MNSGISWNELKLNTAIKDYNDKKYKQAFESFYDFVTTPRSESRKPSNIKIIGLATYYMALCYMYGNGVEQDIERAIGVAEYLHKYKKYEDAWNIYSELAKADNIKLDALTRMANYYNNGYVKKDERLIFEIALELYSKKQYKDAYNIFLKLTNSNDSEIKLITTCIKASYYITGYNDVRKNKNKAIELIIKDITQS